MSTMPSLFNCGLYEVVKEGRKRLWHWSSGRKVNFRYKTETFLSNECLWWGAQRGTQGSRDRGGAKVLSRALLWNRWDEPDNKAIVMWSGRDAIPTLIKGTWVFARGLCVCVCGAGVVVGGGRQQQVNSTIQPQIRPLCWQRVQGPLNYLPALNELLRCFYLSATHTICV